MEPVHPMDTWKTTSTTGRVKIEQLNSDRRYGHTLIELILVLAMVGAAVSLCLPFVSNFFFRSRLKYSAEDIVSTLRWARRLAITKRGEHKVIFSPQRGNYWVEDKEGNVIGEKRSLGENVVFANPQLHKKGEEDGIVELDNPDNSSFSFYSQGTAEAGSIYLKEKDSQRWHTITITGSTGYVRIYPEKH